MATTFVNLAALTYKSTPPSSITSGAVFQFHKSLPSCSGPTSLKPLPAVAKSLDLRNLFLKDESFRFGDLPSFKPLGLSWAIRNAIIAELSEESQSTIPDDISLPDLAEKAMKGQIKLIAASDGKLGKAVARLGKLFGVGGTYARIFVPESAEDEVRIGVREEGAEVIPVAGDLEDAMREACLHAVAVDGVLIDIDAVENYEDVPGWIVEGYSTIFKELDEQLGNTYPDLVVVPVGVGGLAQAAVTHYKAPHLASHSIRVLGVESMSAAAVQASLRQGEVVKLKINEEGTILESLNYDSVALKAWEVLKVGLDLCTAVTDDEVKRGMDELHKGGVEVGPCGGAMLAGLKKVLEEEIGDLSLDREPIVVMIGTQGVK